MKISVLIPMYNEAAVIADTAKTLCDYMEHAFPAGDNGREYEIIFIDDGSCDDSREILRELNLGGVRVCGYDQNRGKGCAVRTGALVAEGDTVVFTDADLAYGTDVIAGLAEQLALDPKKSVIIGSRNISSEGYEGYTFFRKLASKIYIKVICTWGGFKVSDSQCGCKAFRREAAKKIFSLCEVDGFAFDFEVILLASRLGYEIGEMPVKVINHGDSKVRVLRDAFRMLRDLARIKKNVKNKEIKQSSRPGEDENAD